jgi:TPR repeat protein
MILRYVRLTAEQGNAHAQFYHGIMLSRGEGISINKTFAVHYYKLSADQGNAEALLNQGVMLDKGDGILMNKSFAVHGYKSAVDHGLVEGRRFVPITSCGALMPEQIPEIP